MKCKGCLGCTKRTPGCHDSCRDYKIYKICLAVENAKIAEARKVQQYESERIAERARAAREIMHNGY